MQPPRRYHRLARRNSTKIIVPADATKSTTEPFPRWRAKAVTAAFSGFGVLRAEIGIACIDMGTDVK